MALSRQECGLAGPAPLPLPGLLRAGIGWTELWAQARVGRYLWCWGPVGVLFRWL